MNVVGNRPSRYWEKKAADARAQAEAMTSAEARALMVKVAKRYQLMASIAAKKPSGSANRAHRDPNTLGK